MWGCYLLPPCYVSLLFKTKGNKAINCVFSSDLYFALYCRDLPQYGHKQWQSYFGRTFDVYTKLWKFQQQHRLFLSLIGATNGGWGYDSAVAFLVELIQQQE